MAENTVFAGEMNTLVELYKETTTKNASSETVKTPVSLGQKFVKRIDLGGSEELDGRLISLSVAKYIMRYDKDILTNGTKYYITDQDGDFQINSVNLFGTQRNKFIELKCSKRGE
ncbi:hypothetical protein [Terasakiella sp.]|uniref:phage head completion protein n=1 Tax=Terasakiella sp. TaxID=2034861 RepID=UPI003AA8A639